MTDEKDNVWSRTGSGSDSRSKLFACMVIHCFLGCSSSSSYLMALPRFVSDSKFMPSKLFSFFHFYVVLELSQIA